MRELTGRGVAVQFVKEQLTFTAEDAPRGAAPFPIGHRDGDYLTGPAAWPPPNYGNPARIDRFVGPANRCFFAGNYEFYPGPSAGPECRSVRS